MFKKLSLKGIIIGAFVDVGGSAIWGIIVALFLLHPTTSEISQLHDVLVRALNLIVGAGFSVLGGYIAANIAKHNPLRNGVASAFLCILIGLLSSSLSAKLLLEIAMSPLLGLLGGYLVLRHKKNITTR